MKMYLLAAALSAGRCEIYRRNGVVCLHERSGANFRGGGVRARGKRIFVEEKRLWKRINRLTALTVAVAVAFMALGVLLQYILSDVTTASALEEMEFRVEEYGDAIRGVLRSNAQTLETLSSFVRPWESMEAQDVAAEFARALEKSDFEGMAWFPLEGSSVIVSRDGDGYIGLNADNLAEDAQTSIERAQAGETVVSGIYDGSMVLPEGERGLLCARAGPLR